MKIDIGIPEEARGEIIDGLSKLLADSYTLYLKTHNFHWNVTGPMFNALHNMFEEHYLELATAVDSVAERIRALGGRAPGSYREFARLKSVPEAEDELTAEQMVAALVADHETVVRTARSVFPAAERVGDEATADLLTQRLQLHEKTAWMLRSILE